MFPSNSQVIGEPSTLIYDIAPGAPASSGQWNVGPQTTNIVIDGEVECLPRREFGPIGTGNPIPPVYFAAGGYEDADIMGNGNPNETMMEVDATLTVLNSPGDLLMPRLGVALAPLLNGERMLITGAAQGIPRDTSAEVHVTVD